MSKKKKSATELSAAKTSDTEAVWNKSTCLALIDQLWELRKSMLEQEVAYGSKLATVCPTYQDSARNLVHYLSLRNDDLRPLQEKLSWLGLSSLGQSESHVLANLDKVLGVLHRLTNQSWEENLLTNPLAVKAAAVCWSNIHRVCWGLPVKDGQSASW